MLLVNGFFFTIRRHRRKGTALADKEKAIIGKAVLCQRGEVRHEKSLLQGCFYGPFDSGDDPPAGTIQSEKALSIQSTDAGSYFFRENRHAFRNRPQGRMALLGTFSASRGFMYG
jgi:hypothetical protein